MLHNTFIAFLIIFLFHSCLATQTIYIIVPGTWAGEHGWHSVGGDFFEALKKSITQEDASVMTYYWSGKNNYKSREYAAQGLAQLIQSFSDTSIINLVTHSHGGNVGILASQYLEKHKTIKAFYALGTPVDAESYFPNMDVISYFYNFFSFSDFVQTVLGIFQRVYPPHERIANFSVTIDHMQPNHETIHDACIAQWLPMIPEKLSSTKTGNFEQCTMQHPGNIAFFTDAHPRYYIEHNRAELLEEDLHLTQQYCLALQRRNEHEYQQ